MYHQTNIKSGTEYEGYVPDWIGDCGDYVTFTIYRHCGQVQGSWPESDKSLNKFSHGQAS